MRALNDVVEGGYVQYVVVSSYHVWQLRAMRAYGVTNGLTPYMMFQELESSSFTWAEEGQKTSALEVSSTRGCRFPYCSFVPTFSFQTSSRDPSPPWGGQ